MIATGGRLYVFACLLLLLSKRPHAEVNINLSLTLASHRSQSTGCHIPSNLCRVLRIFLSGSSCCNSRYCNAFKALSTSTVSYSISSPPSSTAVSAGSFGGNMSLASAKSVESEWKSFKITNLDKIWVVKYLFFLRVQKSRSRPNMLSFLQNFK